MGSPPYASSGSLSTYFDTDRVWKGMRLTGEFAVVATDKIEGKAYHKKFPVDVNSIFMKLYVTWPTWPKGHIPQKFEFSKWLL
jgi:hypothetical protein